MARALTLKLQFASRLTRSAMTSSSTSQSRRIQTHFGTRTGLPTLKDPLKKKETKEMEKKKRRNLCHVRSQRMASNGRR